jgi:hypothetical protein
MKPSPSSNTATYSVVLSLLLTSINNSVALGHHSTNKQIINPGIAQDIEDDTTYLMKSKKNKERILASLRNTKGTTYQNLEDFKRAYNL